MKPPRKKAGDAGSGSAINWPEVNRVLEFMGQHGLEEFDYSAGELRIHLRKPGTGSPPAVPPALAAGASAGTASASPPSGPAFVSPAPVPAPVSDEEGLHIIKSPIVGTFYSSPNPSSPPFVKAGDQIAVGKVLCIVEAMKLMNEIESEVAGEVVRVLVENGEPVEYGQPLFAIRPVKST